MSDSSSDDDMPIAVLRKKLAQQKAAHSTVRVGSGAGAGAGAGSKKQAKVKTSKPKAKPKAKAKAKGKPKGQATATGKSKSKTMGKTKGTKTKPKTAKRPRGSAGSSGSANKRQRTTQQWNTLDSGRPLKPQAVARILVRWMYCMQYPTPAFLKSLDAVEAPSDYVALPGFPGVFVGVMGDATGSLLDRRSKSGRPSFDDLVARPAEELKQMWVQGVEAQLSALVAAEGEEAAYVSSLRKELQTARKFNAKKAEKQYLKTKHAAAAVE